MVGRAVPATICNTTVDNAVQTDIEHQHLGVQTNICVQYSGIQTDHRIQDNGVQTDPLIHDNNVQTDLIEDHCTHTDSLIHDVLNMDVSNHGPMDPVSNVNGSHGMTGDSFMEIVCDDKRSAQAEEALNKHTVSVAIQCHVSFLWSHYVSRTLMDTCCRHALVAMILSMLRGYRSFLKHLLFQILETITHRA
jgi:hypothetical protein